MDLETQSEVDNSVYTIIDSPTGYGKKFPLGGLVKEVSDLKQDFNQIVPTELMINRSGLTTGKYYGQMYYGSVPTAIDNSDSVYTPTALDLSDYVGGTLKIIREGGSAPTGSSRYMGFVNDNGKAVVGWSEGGSSTWKQTATGWYFEKPIATAHFLFSGRSDVTKLEIIASKPSYYSRDEVDDITDAQDKKINVVKRYVGLGNNVYTLNNETVHIMNNVPNRASTNQYTAEAVHSVAFTAPPDGYMATVFYYTSAGESYSPLGWITTSGSANAIADAVKWELEFRRSDNGNFSSSEMDTLMDGLSITVTSEVVPVNKAVIVSTDGNDETGDGSNSNPYATVDVALSSGASVVWVRGGVYNQQIDLQRAIHPHVTISKYQNDEKVVFRKPLFEITSESNVDGYTYVHKASFSGTIRSQARFLWQEGVADTRTEITNAERNAYQRGQKYRLFNTKITKCDETVLADALAEIEANPTNFRWFFDATNGIIYFSRPETVSATYPICGDGGLGLLRNTNLRMSVKLVGIETNYMYINTVQLNTPEIIDCKAAYVTSSGGFVYDQCVGAKFVRCEACGVASGVNGDGFNGHSLETGDPFSKQTTCELIDCWSHDNLDDGYSDHERSETVIRGGLYEYNGKGGITPSYGSHCTCFGVLSRKNLNGFYYTGEATEAEGGMYGQMSCYDCVAIGNLGGSSNGIGFRINGNNNSMLLVNCKSIANRIGYSPEYSTNRATLIDCTAKDNTEQVKGGSGTYAIYNGTAVTA